ncbi:MAG: phosphoglucomutase/phosphomannomutase family protein, partial [Nitrospiraceae bacterium]|nr:phosphoglucomutase/phosphomannomutase family protein [Nitrospiraceae bacterium]
RMLMEGKSLSKLVNDLFNEFGTAYYKRIDLPVTQKERDRLEALKENPPESFKDKKVVRVLTIDGLKLIFNDDSWLLLRPSGTEPVFRVYAEAPTENETHEIISWASKLLKG